MSSSKNVVPSSMNMNVANWINQIRGSPLGILYGRLFADRGLLQGLSRPGKSFHFDNEAKQTLRQIYSVLYYMQRNHDFVDAVRRTKDNFNIAYQSVDDKCARRFAGTVDMFQRWYRSGEILQRLKDHFHLNYHDCKNFEELLTSKFKRDL